MDANFSEEQIRQAVREALLEAIPASDNNRTDRKVVGNCALMAQILESIGNNCKTPIKVDIDDGCKFNDFVRDLVKCVTDKNVEAMILANRLKFELQSASNRRSAPVRPPEREKTSNGHKANEGHLESGVLTESKILALAKTTKRVVIGSKVVLTPLARDRARTVGLEIVRQ